MLDLLGLIALVVIIFFIYISLPSGYVGNSFTKLIDWVKAKFNDASKFK